MTSISLAEYKKLYGNKPNSKLPKHGVKKQSKGEQTLGMQLKALKIAFKSEFRFHPTRKWRADFYIEDTKLLIEVEGGIWSGGRHTRGKGYLGDMDKYNAATAMGYQVFRFSTEQVISGFAIKQIEELVRG